MAEYLPFCCERYGSLLVRISDEPLPGSLSCVLGQIPTQVYKEEPGNYMLEVTLWCSSIPSRGE